MTTQASPKVDLVFTYTRSSSGRYDGAVQVVSHADGEMREVWLDEAGGAMTRADWVRFVVDMIYGTEGVATVCFRYGTDACKSHYISRVLIDKIQQRAIAADDLIL